LKFLFSGVQSNAFARRSISLLGESKIFPRKIKRKRQALPEHGEAPLAPKSYLDLKFRLATAITRLWEKQDDAIWPSYFAEGWSKQIDDLKSAIKWIEYPLN